MNDDFIPQNDLETQLLRAQNGEIDGSEFLQVLLESQIFMPVYEKYQIANLQTSDKAQPLVLENEDGTRTLVLFTAPERAKTFVQDYPGYGGGLLVELKWVFEKLGTGFDLILNPGWSTGLELEAEVLQQLSSRLH